MSRFPRPPRESADYLDSQVDGGPQALLEIALTRSKSG